MARVTKAQLEENLHLLVEECNTLQESLGTMDSENKKLSKANDLLKKSAKLMNSEIMELRKELSDVRSHNEELVGKITRLNKDLSELRAIHVEEEAVVERATADMQSYNEERSSLQANVKELRLILANHRNFNTHMVKALSAVLDTHGIQLIIEETCNAMKRS